MTTHREIRVQRPEALIFSTWFYGSKGWPVASAPRTATGKQAWMRGFRLRSVLWEEPERWVFVFMALRWNWGPPERGPGFRQCLLHPARRPPLPRPAAPLWQIPGLLQPRRPGPSSEPGRVGVLVP